MGEFKLSSVSVIVPIYNIEKYIDKCISSIINQTFRDIEIILVNDGSTDNSYNICESYKMRDDRIVLVNKENGGLSSARNRGIEKATGKYIAFIDGDDYVHPRFIEKLFNAINDADIAVCGIEIIDERGNKTNYLATGDKYEEYIPFKNEILSPNVVERKYYIEKNGFIFVVAWNKLYKKEIFDKIRYDEGKNFEDELIFSSLLRQCKVIQFLPDKLYYYVQRKNGITGKSKYDEKYMYLNEILERRIKLYKEHDEKKLLRLAYIKHLRQTITYYAKLERRTKIIAKRSYRKILSEKNVPWFYYLFYFGIGLLSRMKMKGCN